MYLHDYANPREARCGLNQYLTFYNHERPHQALDYRTPAQVYYGKEEARLSRTYPTVHSEHSPRLSYTALPKQSEHLIPNTGDCHTLKLIPVVS